MDFNYKGQLNKYEEQDSEPLQNHSIGIIALNPIASTSNASHQTISLVSVEQKAIIRSTNESAKKQIAQPYTHAHSIENILGKHRLEDNVEEQSPPKKQLQETETSHQQEQPKLQQKPPTIHRHIKLQRPCSSLPPFRSLKTAEPLKQHPLRNVETLVPRQPDTQLDMPQTSQAKISQTTTFEPSCMLPHDLQPLETSQLQMSYSPNFLEIQLNPVQADYKNVLPCDIQPLEYSDLQLSQSSNLLLNMSSQLSQSQTEPLKSSSQQFQEETQLNPKQARFKSALPHDHQTLSQSSNSLLNISSQLLLSQTASLNTSNKQSLEETPLIPEQASSGNVIPHDLQSVEVFLTTEIYQNVDKLLESYLTKK